MREISVVLLAAIMLCSTASVAAGSRIPVAVSPGTSDDFSRVADPCTTFSWAAPSTAAGLTLAVYELTASVNPGRAVILQNLPSQASSWTVQAGRCLSRGKTYAWTIGAVGKDGIVDWSDPVLFQIDREPTTTELRDGPGVVETYGEGRETGSTTRQQAQSTILIGSSAPPTVAESDGLLAEPSMAESSVSSPSPAVPAAPAAVSLVIDGAVAVGRSTPLADLHVVGGPALGGMLLAPNVASNGGSSELLLAEDEDGSYGVKLKYDGAANELQILGHAGSDTTPWLTIQRDSGATRIANFGADPPCYDYVQRFADCGNGTVADSVTGLIFLKDADCLGFADWKVAVQSAAALAHGACSLTDGSRAGDWRLATKEEWEALLDSSCATDPEIVGNGNTAGTPGCYSAYPWAVDVVNDKYWTSTSKVDDTDNGWRANMVTGLIDFELKGGNAYIWPVRSR